MLLQPETPKLTVMTIALLHNYLRSIHSTAVFTPSGTFDHEIDGKLVERTGDRSAIFLIRKMPWRSSAYAKELGDENGQYCQKKGRVLWQANYTYIKLYVHKIHTHCVRLSLSTRNALHFYANHALSEV